jgi:hypothetical protein
MRRVSYADLKAFVTARGLSVQYVEFANVWWLAAIDGALALDCQLDKGDNSSEVADFVATLQAGGNKPIEPRDAVLNRKITSMSAFAVNSDYEVKATGFAATAAGATGSGTVEDPYVAVTTNVDHAVGGEDRYINGLELLIGNAAMGDTVDFKVVDVNNVLGYGAGVLLKQFGFSWNVAPDRVSQGVLSFNYLARLMAGLYVRLSYRAVTAGTRKVSCNLLLHKKVIVV